MTTLFDHIPIATYKGKSSVSPFAFRWYQPEQKVGNKTMLEHLRFSACYWHNFCWSGNDPFGNETFPQPWKKHTNPIDAAKEKADNAFAFFKAISVPYFTFHDTDIAPENDNITEQNKNVHTMAEYLQEKMQENNIKLLWGTANLFSHKRFMSGASTNPDPAVVAWCASQVKTAMDVTRKLNGENYVLWGGREGYETLLNTNIKQERTQMGRFLNMVVDYKHKIGLKGNILIEPKPKEPTKHQYDTDVATIYGFLKQYGLEKEVRVNLEANHAILAGHTFEHEIQMATALGIFGSLDINRGDYLLGWDTDQFPCDIYETTLLMINLLNAGGFTTGGMNFDAKRRRQSINPDDLVHAHIGAMDLMAKSLLIAHEIQKDGVLQNYIDNRYKGWKDTLGQNIMNSHTLETLAQYAENNAINPKPVSGQQEFLENLINRYILT